MFKILTDKTICLTRGDVASIIVSANLQDGALYTFKPGDTLRFRVFKKRDCACTVIQKDVIADKETESLIVNLTKTDTTIGEIISKPVDYWYEVEVNPETEPQTIIGYDEAGEKIFRLYPEGSEAN